MGGFILPCKRLKRKRGCLGGPFSVCGEWTTLTLNVPVYAVRFCSHEDTKKAQKDSPHPFVSSEDEAPCIDRPLVSARGERAGLVAQNLFVSSCETIWHHAKFHETCPLSHMNCKGYKARVAFGADDSE